jgi:VanZ family protein
MRCRAPSCWRARAGKWSARPRRQRQLAALSGRISIAVLGQAAVFGLMHAYRGWKAVSVICFLGALFGVVAAWRRSTRPGMIVHAMADIWGGWLKGALHFPY